MPISDKIAVLIYKKGWTQDEAAQAFDVKTRTLQYWLAGRDPRNKKAVENLIDFYLKNI